MIPEGYVLMKVVRLTENYGSYNIGDYVLVQRKQYLDKDHTYIEFIVVTPTRTRVYYRISNKELSVVNNDIDLNSFLDNVDIHSMYRCIDERRRYVGSI